MMGDDRGRAMEFRQKGTHGGTPRRWAAAAMAEPSSSSSLSRFTPPVYPIQPLVGGSALRVFLSHRVTGSLLELPS